MLFFSILRYKITMGGGLMQLVAYGAQDIYLTGNPQITFFKVVYRRHTNFSMEAIEQTLSGQNAIGGTVTSTISRNGDLIHNMYVNANISEFGDEKSGNPGTTLLKMVQLEIGGQRIDRYYNDWLETWAELTQVNPGGLIAGAPYDHTGSTLYQKMSGSAGVIGHNGGQTDQTDLMIPLPFWFCRNVGLALPLIALQYHEVKIDITLNETGGFGGSEPVTLDTAGISLWVDYIYLDTDERRRFAQVSHEYLIEQVQRISATDSSQVELNFNHPVKELIWIGKPETSTGNDYGDATPVSISPDTTQYHLKLNGHDRFERRKTSYFTRCQVWKHHTGFGGTIKRDSIAVYSFALKPEEHQPSGTCNFSRIDDARLVRTGSLTASGLIIYAVNYNVLRIMSGMGGLAYSN